MPTSASLVAFASTPAPLAFWSSRTSLPSLTRTPASPVALARTLAPPARSPRSSRSNNSPTCTLKSTPCTKKEASASPRRPPFCDHQFEDRFQIGGFVPPRVRPKWECGQNHPYKQLNLQQPRQTNDSRRSQTEQTLAKMFCIFLLIGSSYLKLDAAIEKHFAYSTERPIQNQAALQREPCREVPTRRGSEAEEPAFLARYIQSKPGPYRALLRQPLGTAHGSFEEVADGGPAAC